MDRSAFAVEAITIKGIGKKQEALEELGWDSLNRPAQFVAGRVPWRVRPGGGTWRSSNHEDGDKTAHDVIT
jgi:hypothetical protein